jgi:hypothetical protein
VGLEYESDNPATEVPRLSAELRSLIRKMDVA